MHAPPSCTHGCAIKGTPKGSSKTFYCVWAKQHKQHSGAKPLGNLFCQAIITTNFVVIKQLLNGRLTHWHAYDNFHFRITSFFILFILHSLYINATETFRLTPGLQGVMLNRKNLTFTI